MYWFKHDTNASIDNKLQTLMLEYGAEGYGLYWYCVELIAQNVNKDNITFELEHDSRIIARNLNLSIQKTMDMMKRMVELELFSFSSNDKFACYALAKRLDQSMTSNPDFRALIDKVKKNHDSIMINHGLVMQDKEKNSEAFKIASYLLDKILSIKPNFKKPNLNTWAKDIDLAIIKDDRTNNSLMTIIDWIYSSNGSWWQPYILSGKKLREKFDTIELQMNNIPTKSYKKEPQVGSIGWQAKQQEFGAIDAEIV